ncbi:MAG: hypothetical protein HY355_00680 [Armatimonadetes bacterium]|nr:hypothetical protein [Armatimonadota bacterium]
MAISESTDMGARDGPTVYHLADVRLGGAFPFLGQAGAAHRQQVRETFARAVDRGLDLSPSLVAISGNLFGTPFPARDLAEFARTQIGRFSERGIAVLVAAGPLDALYEKTYAAGALAELERVSVFPAAVKTVELPDLDATAVGASWSATPVQPDFLAALATHAGRQNVIGVAHLALPATEEGLRALRRQIAASGARYLALGGSPTRRDLSADGIVAWCPGAPELIALEEGERSPLLVHLGGAAPTVTLWPVARRRYARFNLKPAAYASPEDLADAIRALGDPHLVASVRLTGASGVTQFIDTADLHSRLAGAFLALEIVDESLPPTDALAAAPYPDLSVAGKFVAVARREMERSGTDEGRRRVGAALRLGLALLEGRRPG